MTREERKAAIDAQFVILADRMDRQQAYFDELWSYVDKHGDENVPPKHKVAWIKAQIQGRRPWRENRLVMARVKAAARKAAKNAVRKGRKQ